MHDLVLGLEESSLVGCTWEVRCVVLWDRCIWVLVELDSDSLDFDACMVVLGRLRLQ